MILNGNIFSETLEMETSISIVAPEKPNKTPKTIYLLHGICGRSGDWIDYTMLPSYAKQFNIVFIMPEVARSFYANMKYGLNYFGYVTEELPMLCKGILNISTDRDNTAIIGASMGGYGALKSALTLPEQYGFCAAFSSPCLLMKEDLARTQGAIKFKQYYGERLFKDFQAAHGENIEWDPKNDILELAKKASIANTKPKIYTACGTEDYMLNDHNIFSSEMAKLNFDYTHETWKGNHDWFFFDEALRKALNFDFFSR